MKKSLVLLLIAVVAAGAFAQSFDFSGQIFGNAILGAGTNGKDANGDSIDPTAGGTMGRIRFNANAVDKDGIFGAWARFQSGWSLNTSKLGDPAGALFTFDGQGGAVAMYGYAFWKPVEMFRLQVGVNPSGEFSDTCVADWDFYDLAGDVGVVQENWLFENAFYAGFSSPGSLITLTPAEAVEINIAVPFEDMNGSLASDVYKNTNARIAYTIDGVGKVAVTYAGGSADTINYDDSGSVVTGSNGGTFFGYFNYDSIDNLNLELGVGYQLAVTDNTILNKDQKYTSPVSVGLGVTYDVNEQFGFKVRVMGQFGQKFSPVTGDDQNGPTVVVADILPYYAISDTFKFYLSAGINFTKPDSDKVTVFNSLGSSDNIIGWHVNPYVSKAIGDGAFIAGVRIDSDGLNYKNGTAVIKDGDKVINWSIPIAVSYSF